MESEDLRVVDVCRFSAFRPIWCTRESRPTAPTSRTPLSFPVHLAAAGDPAGEEDSGKLCFPYEREGGPAGSGGDEGLLWGDTAAQSAWYKAMREVGGYSVNRHPGLCEDQPKVLGGDSRYASWN